MGEHQLDKLGVTGSSPVPPISPFGNRRAARAIVTIRTLQEKDIPVLLFHLNQQAGKLAVQIYKAVGSPVHPVFNYAIQLNYLPRNSTATSSSSSTGTGPARRTTAAGTVTTGRSSRTERTC